MKLYPAIDIRNGNVVRLTQGDFSQETIYAEDPVKMALQFRQAGATHLHVVDLDGAREGRPVNLDLIASIVRGFDGFVQTGGGIRSPEIADSLLEAGVSRLILGTAALTDPFFLKKMVDRCQDRFYVGVDVKEGAIALRGWLSVDTRDPMEVMVRLVEEGVRGFVYTDIARDGLLSGPNFDRTEEVKRTVRVPVIASGGVTSLSDLQRLREMGVDGAIVGRALYTGDMNLAEALSMLGGRGAGCS